MKSFITTMVFASLIIGCTFKGEIEDNRGGPETPNLEENKHSKQESIGELRYYGLEIGSGKEFSRTFKVTQSENGVLNLNSALVLPQGVSTGAFNLQAGDNDVIGHLELISPGSEEATPLERLNGSGTDQVEYRIDSEALRSETAKQIRFHVVDDNGLNKVIESELFVAPQDIEVNVIAPAQTESRDSAKDIFSEKGTLYYLHDLIVRNNHNLELEVETPAVLSANYLVRRYEDVTIPNQEARAVDSKKCGNAVSKSRRFPEDRTQQVGLFLIPNQVRSKGSVSQYLSSEANTLSLGSGDAILFEVYVLGRPDLNITKQIFASNQVEKNTVMSGCKSKKDYYEPPGCDTGRVYSEKNLFTGVSTDKSIQCGRYRYWGRAHSFSMELSIWDIESILRPFR
jgi:hypothetical protein